ncbi:hypothetical protein GOACH_24_00200 [Gordonia aichiensis NBRC 108223]|uniref:Uncharacterized protein n=1 Tax=Gordonia aichiensis NBRC 108223 TaxID=1220583 RepID=L7KP51_9ACTN|nr:hypothetical protein GOACH_24_00200 [Gordonia aichiensis NBRC 108223]
MYGFDEGLRQPRCVRRVTGISQRVQKVLPIDAIVQVPPGVGWKLRSAAVVPCSCVITEAVRWRGLAPYTRVPLMAWGMVTPCHHSAVTEFLWIA